MRLRPQLPRQQRLGRNIAVQPAQLRPVQVCVGLEIEREDLARARLCLLLMQVGEVGVGERRGRRDALARVEL
jgi:hypothetical protein